MIRQSKLALEAYHREGFSVNHDRVRQWADSLGTDAERPCSYKPQISNSPSINIKTFD